MAECPVETCEAVNKLAQNIETHHKDAEKSRKEYHDKQEAWGKLIEGIHRGLYGDPDNPETSKGLIKIQKEQGNSIKDLQGLMPEIDTLKRVKTWLYAVSVVVGGTAIIGAFVFFLKMAHIINSGKPQ